MLEDDWNDLLEDYPTYRDEKDDFFVKIECHNQAEFSEFVIYTRIAKLPNDSLYFKVFQRRCRSYLDSTGDYAGSRLYD